MIEDGHAVHYTAVAVGTPVYSSDEVQVGAVEQVLDNYREHIFDGIVLRTTDGELRFVDAPEVRRTAERAVTLTISAADVAQLPEPDSGPPQFEVRRGAGRVARKLGFGWKRRR